MGTTVSPFLEQNSKCMTTHYHQQTSLLAEDGAWSDPTKALTRVAVSSAGYEVSAALESPLPNEC